MERVVYADVLWLIDFSMDLLALGLAGRMAQRVGRSWRLCLAAGLGGVWSVLVLVAGLDGVGGLLLDLAVAAGLVLLAYGRTSPGRFALTLGGFFLATLLLGGSMTALANLFTPAEGTPSGGGFFALALAGSGVTLLGTQLRRRAAPRRVALTVTVGERCVTLDALSDSGNLVRDPVSGRGVIFVAPRCLAQLLDRRLARVLTEGQIAVLANLPPEDARRLCLVPMTTVQGRAMRLTLRPDRVEVAGEACAALLAAMQSEAGVDAIVPAALCAAGEPISIGKKAKR